MFNDHAAFWCNQLPSIVFNFSHEISRSIGASLNALNVLSAKHAIGAYWDYLYANNRINMNRCHQRATQLLYENVRLFA